LDNLSRYTMIIYCTVVLPRLVTTAVFDLVWLTDMQQKHLKKRSIQPVDLKKEMGRFGPSSCFGLRKQSTHIGIFTGSMHSY
jgi:hypothetical protein